MSSPRWVTVWAALALTFASADNVIQYDGYHLLRVVPQNSEHIETLISLQRDPELDFWKAPHRPGFPVDVFVSPKRLPKIKHALLDAGLQPVVLMNDAQSLIDSQIETFLSPRSFDWNDYQTLEAIHEWLREQAQRYNKIATIITAGYSVEGRPLLGLRIAHNTNLPIVFVESGIHAREWISPATATWFIQQALNTSDELIKSYEWHVFPSVNPDGYVYTQTDRIWRKSRKSYGLCDGVDLNRNWPFQWKAESHDDCSDTYPGPRPASEPEIQGLVSYLSSVANRTRVFISLHSYSQLLMYPWSYTTRRPEKNSEFIAVARKALDKLGKRYGTSYGYGPVAEAIYTSHGTAVDYAYSLNITYPYVFELRDTGDHGYLLPKEQILPTALETFDAVSVILQEAKNAKN